MKRWKKQIWLIPFAAFLIGSLCSCSYREFEDNVKLQMEEQSRKKEKQEQKEQAAEADKEAAADGTYALTIHAGEENEEISVDGIGSRVDFTIHDVKFYQKAADFPDAENLADYLVMDLENSGFLTMEIEVTNIDYAGDYRDGAINMTLIGVGKTDRDEEAFAETEVAYLSPHGEGETYWHLLVKPGETKTCTMGFLLDTTDASRLGEYKIAQSGIVGEGSHEIPYQP